MKVAELSAINNMIRAGTGVERRESAVPQSGFRAVLSELTQSNYMEKLQQMCDNVAKQGAAVTRRCDILELKRYREMLAEFMYEAVRFSFEFKKQSTVDIRGRHRMYAIIKRLNEKLEELTKEVLSGQADNLAVMNAIDEIRGMLIDLLL